MIPVTRINICEKYTARRTYLPRKSVFGGIAFDGFPGVALPEFRFDGTGDRRDEGDHDDSDDDQFEIILHEGYAPEEIPEKHEERNPRYPTDDVVNREFNELHMCDARDEGCERSDDREETRDHYGERAISIEETLCLLNALGREGFDSARVDDRVTESTTDPIVRSIAQNRSDPHQDKQGPNIQPTAISGEDTRGEKQ